MLTEKIETIAFGIDAGGVAAGRVDVNPAGDRLLANGVFPAGSLQDVCAALRELIDQPDGDGIDDTSKHVTSAGHTVSWAPATDEYRFHSGSAPFTEAQTESLLRACQLGGLYTPV